ncbi:hypothetical protein [Mucilaginibacter paludis]|nr:hypothetical protein [Mucilaginibacter paludis]
MPYLSNDQGTNNFIIAFNVEFNYLSGSNIRLALLTRNTQAYRLAKDTDSYFKNYFGLTESSNKRNTLGPNRLFMPFPVNSIKYGLYNHLPTTQLDDFFKREFSKIILDAMFNEKIDNELILTLAFYLNVGFIKALNLAQQFNGRLPLRAYPEVSCIKAKFLESEIALNEITREIMNGTHVTFPKWLMNWVDLCEDFISKQLEQVNNFFEVQYKVERFINQSLSLTPEEVDLLRYIVEQSLRKYHDEKEI